MSLLISDAPTSIAPPTPRTRIVSIDDVRQGALLMEGAVVFAASDARAAEVARLCMIAWEHNCSVLLVRRAADPSKWPDFPLSLLVDVSAEDWPILTRRIARTFASTLFLAPHLRLRAAARLRWYRVDPRPGPAWNRLHDELGGAGSRACSASVHVPDELLSRWKRSRPEEPLSFVEVFPFEALQHAEVLAFLPGEERQDPRALHPVHLEDLGRDPRPYDGLVQEPMRTPEVALRIAELHLKHRSWAATLQTARAIAGRQAREVEHPDEDFVVEAYAGTLLAAVLDLLGDPGEVEDAELDEVLALVAPASRARRLGGLGSARGPF